MHAVLLFQSTKHQVQVLSPFHASNVNLYDSSFIALLITKDERETTPYKSHYPHNLFSLGTITCSLITQSWICSAFAQLSSACPTNTVTITKYLFFVYLNPFKQRISSEI